MLHLFIFLSVISCQLFNNSRFGNDYIINQTKFNEETSSHQENKYKYKNFHISSTSCETDVTFTFDSATLTISGSGDMCNYSQANAVP